MSGAARWLAVALAAGAACRSHRTESNQRAGHGDGRAEDHMTTTTDLHDPELTRRIDAAVTAYVAKAEGWPRDAYQIEPRRRDGASIVVDAVHEDDTRPSPSGGSGKSLQLYLNASTFEVEKVLHFQ